MNGRRVSWSLILVASLCVIGCGDAQPPRPSTGGAGSAAGEEEPSAEADGPEGADEQPAPEGRAPQEGAGEGVASPAGYSTRRYPAINGVLFGERIVIHEPASRQPADDDAAPGPLTLSAYSVLSDQPLWRIERGGNGEEAWIQRFDAGHVLVRVENRLELVDVNDGTVTASHEFRGQGRFLWSQSGVCLLNTGCSVDLIDCSDARPLRTLHVGVSTRRPLRGGDRPTPCLGGPTIVGRSDNVLVLAMSNWQTNLLSPQSHHHTGADSWVGIDAQSGDIVWHHRYPDERSDSTHVGAAGQFAWFADDEGVTIIRGTTGRLLRRVAHPNLRYVFPLDTQPPSIELLSAGAVEVVELARGRRVFRRAIPEGAIAVVAGAPFPPLGHIAFGESDGSQRFVWMNARGETEHEEVIPQGESLQAGEPGARWRSGARPTYDSAGDTVRNLEFVVERRHVPADERGPPNHARLTREGALVAEFDTDAWSLGEARRDEDFAVALFLKGANWRTDGAVHVFRARGQ